jgi:hypothetical protein
MRSDVLLITLHEETVLLKQHVKGRLLVSISRLQTRIESHSEGVCVGEAGRAIERQLDQGKVFFVRFPRGFPMRDKRIGGLRQSLSERVKCHQERNAPPPTLPSQRTS